MCTKCKNYFCRECAYYHNNLSKTQNYNCPGYFKGLSEEHPPLLVKITKNMTGPDLKGVSLSELSIKRNEPKESTIKILEKSENKVEIEKSKVKILGTNLKKNSHFIRPVKKQPEKRKPRILDDE